MIETKFTKGPWSAKRQGEFNFNVCVLSRRVSVYSSVKAVNDAIFDAHLIAAAPDMYALLDEISDGLLEAGGFGNCELAKRIEELLAKARGDK
jgi:hypothetical protein